MISTNEFKTNVTVTIDGDPWQVVEFQHVKPGKGAAFVRAKMRNMSTGAVVERTFNAGERMPKARIERRPNAIIVCRLSVFNIFIRVICQQFSA